MILNRSFSTLLAAAASATLLAGAALAADPIKIGVPVGLSGANSVVAPSVVQSAQLAVEEINAKGGVLGRQLALEVADDASGAAGAQKAFDSLVFQKKVDVLISMETSAAGVTVRVVAPDTEPKVAVTVVDPSASAFARPVKPVALLMVATLGVDELQTTDAERSWTELSV